MSDKKKRAPIYRSPVGIARYPWLTKPDTKFKKEGNYRIDLILEGQDADDLKAFVDKGIEASVAAAKADPKNKGKKIKQADPCYQPVKNDEGEETAQTKFSFKMAASGVRKDGSKWERRPMLFDSKGKPILNAKVGGGSKVKVAYQMMPFYTALVGAGVSLRLEAVQIIDLVEYGTRDASDYGFEEEEGYSPEEQPERTDERAEAATGETSGDSSEEF